MIGEACISPRSLSPTSDGKGVDALEECTLSSSSDIGVNTLGTLGFTLAFTFLADLAPQLPLGGMV